MHEAMYNRTHPIGVVVDNPTPRRARPAHVREEFLRSERERTGNRRGENGNTERIVRGQRNTALSQRADRGLAGNPINRSVNRSVSNTINNTASNATVNRTRSMSSVNINNDVNNDNFRNDYCVDGSCVNFTASSQANDGVCNSSQANNDICNATVTRSKSSVNTGASRSNDNYNDDYCYDGSCVDFTVPAQMNDDVNWNDTDYYDEYFNDSTYGEAISNLHDLNYDADLDISGSTVFDTGIFNESATGGTLHRQVQRLMK